MHKYDVWIAITRCMASVGLLEWNADVFGAITPAVVTDAQIRFVSSVSPPRYQTKTILWTLAEVFDIYIEQRQYSSCLIKTQLETSSGVHNLGVGSIKSKLTTGPSLVRGSAVLGKSNATSNEPTSNVPAVGVSTPVLSNQSQSSQTNDSALQLDDEGYTDIQAGTNGLSFDLTYLDHGAIISDKAFFRTIVNLLTFAAQHDPKSAPSMPMTVYSSVENYTFSLGPTSYAMRVRLSWKLVIPALGYLPTEMMTHGRGGRWAEFTGRIRLDGAYIGKVQILKGDTRESSLGSCGTTTLGSGVHLVQNDDSENEAQEQ